MELGNMIFGNSRGEFSVDRDWQDFFCDSLRECGFSGYGWIDDERLLKYNKEMADNSGLVELSYFENDTFIVRPYYWGENEDIAYLPNFVYKPTQFELSWYKYPLRDSYMNQDITFDELKLIFDKCKNSLK